MFGSRKKEKVKAAAAENAAYFTGLLEGIKQEIGEIRKMSDAGERYLAFVNIETKIQSLMTEATQKVNEQVERLLIHPQRVKEVATTWGTVGTLITAGIVGAVVVPIAPVVIPVVGGSCILVLCGGGTTAALIETANGGKRAKVFKESYGHFCYSMKELLSDTIQQRTAIIKNELPGLAASSRFDELYDGFPTVKDAFTKAAIKDAVRPQIIKLDKPSYPKPKT